MSFPAEGVESAFKNHIDDVRTYLEYKYRNGYAVYNLSQRTYRVAKFENRVRWQLTLINILSVHFKWSLAVESGKCNKQYLFDMFLPVKCQVFWRK